VKRVPFTLVIGLTTILGCEALLFLDVRWRGGAVVPLPAGAELPEPQGWLGDLARWVAMNMTVLCWVGYLFTFDGLLTWLGRRRGEPGVSSIRARPNRFVVAWLTSVPVWCFFDYVNFAFLDAWRYHGLPGAFGERAVGYFIAFAAISPGMMLAAQWLQQLGLGRLRTSGVRITLPWQVGTLALGVAFIVYPFVVRDPIGCLTLWVSLLFLLDPVNFWLGAPSVIGDWRAGRWGRTLSLMAGGALCGLLWEFWNYWALAKWTYHLPFVGRLADFRYFEMPWVGFLGFLPFALECWVVLNTILSLVDRVGLRLAEPLTDHISVI
jgi:hypothetical protein